MPKKPTTSKVLNARDPRGDLHSKAAAISEALTGEVDYTAGLIHALSFTAEYYRRPSKHINYATATLDLLRDYCIHGYDFTIRAAALAEIEERLSAPLKRIIDLIEKSEPCSVHPVTKEPIGRRPRAQQIIDIASAAIKEVEATK